MDIKYIDFFNNPNYPQKSNKDKNIFNTGIFNMYENPFTEILSFILRPNSPYDNRHKFIKYFISELTKDENTSDSFCNELNIETQFPTKDGNFIDMIIYNNEYVIVLENKIEHIPINPFEEYVSEIKERYASKKILCYIFSLYECENIVNWKNKLIGDVFSVIKNKLQFKYNNKWDYFVEDFLDKYIEENVQMTKEEFNFSERNFPKLMEGKDLLDYFINSLINQLYQKFDLQKDIKRHTQDDGSIALILYPFKKKDTPHIALHLGYTEKPFSVLIAHNNKSGKSVSELLQIAGYKYSQIKTKAIIFGIKDNYLFNNLNDAYKEIKKQWKKIKEIYT